MTVLRHCLTVTGCWCCRRVGVGWGSVINVGMREIHNHWSHCWAPIRPAVSSLKGQKSIPLHHRAGSMVISAHAISLVQAHITHTPKPHETDSVTGLSLSLMGLMSFTNNVIEEAMGYTVIQGLFLWKNAIPFFFLKKQQTAFSTPMMTEEHVMIYEPTFDWLMCLSYEHCLWWSHMKLRTTF